MAANKTDIKVYAHWVGIPDPVKMGTLSAQEARGHLTWSFSYNKDWLKSRSQLLLDPQLQWYEGPQYSPDKPNFGIFLDSMPDRWGRTLMQRKEALLDDSKRKSLTDLDFLLGVDDQTRMGGLRFKLDDEGSFLANDNDKPVPPITALRELQYAADLIESDEDSEEIREWLRFLLAPGSSLGGARPKASVTDENGELWIAKFPSRQDDTDKGLWEYLAWELARDAGIEVPEAKLLKVSGNHHTFLTKRFDRIGESRIHFASAMTMTGRFEGEGNKSHPSYLEIAEFLQFSGAFPDKDLEQLWRRIIFNIAISNTDDHLRNHGFIIKDNGWRLSPAYDTNPSVDKSGLALNIDLYSNALDFDIAKNVGVHFNLKNKQMDEIIKEVIDVVATWKTRAVKHSIPSVQLRLMERAFNID